MKFSSHFQTLLLGVAISAAHSAQAQLPQRCGHTYMMQHGATHNAGFEQAIADGFADAQVRGNRTQSTRITYTIPVVVHVVYNPTYPAQNLADSVITDQIRVLNEAFNHTHEDTAGLRSVFKPLAGRSKIKFVLANTDPQGNPTTGITRTPTQIDGFTDILGLLTGDMSANERVKATADGGIDAWNPAKYLNIWICDMSVVVFGQRSTALLGYATPPPSLPNWPPGSVDGLSDGVVIQFECFGSNNPNPLYDPNDPLAIMPIRGRTTVHEVGHYFGLRHIWADDSDCTESDGISDTPNAAAESEFDCDLQKNSCPDPVPGFGDLPDMVENYMDYSSELCQSAFTAGQVALMQGTVVAGGYRNSLTTWYTSVDRNAQSPLMSVSPNPAADMLHLRLREGIAQPLSFRICSLTGAAIAPALSLSAVQHHDIDISYLPNGVYFLQITGENIPTATQKFVVLR